MRCQDGSCLSRISFPLTPSLSFGERGPRRPSLEWPAHLDLSQRGRWFSLSPRERDGVRGKRCSDKPLLNLMTVTLALPAKRRELVPRSYRINEHARECGIESG